MTVSRASMAIVLFSQTVLVAQALNVVSHVKINDEKFCSGGVAGNGGVLRVNGLKDPVRCIKDKFDGAISKMIQLCYDIPGLKGGAEDEAPCSEVVAAGTWMQYATKSKKCSDRWPYLMKIHNGIRSSDSATQQMTVDVLKATVAWSLPFAKASTSFSVVYQNMDTSADGKLSVDEFSSNFATEKAPVVDRLFKVVDLNGDSYITSEELKNYFRGIYPIMDMSPESIWPSSIVADASISDEELESVGDVYLEFCNYWEMM